MRTGRVCGWRHGVFPTRLACQRSRRTAESPRPELRFGQHIFVWTGRAATPLQEELLSHWQEQGFASIFTAKISAPIRGADQGLSAWLQVNLAPGFERFAAADIKNRFYRCSRAFNQIQPDLINGFYMQV